LNVWPSGVMAHSYSETLRAELGRFRKLAKLHLDFDVALFAFHLRLAVRIGHEGGTTEVDLRRAASMPVADCLSCAFGYVDPVDPVVPITVSFRFEGVWADRAPPISKDTAMRCFIWLSRFVFGDRLIRRALFFTRQVTIQE
jgi:hypothetical protein